VRDYELEERTIGRILADKADRIGARTFLIWEGQRTTYAELEAMTNRYANGFAAHGIGHGDHVAIMLPNCPEFFGVVWGLGKIGAVAVPLNTAAKGDMLRYFVDQSDATCVVVDDEWVDRVAVLAMQLPKVRSYVYRGPKPASACGLGSAAAPVRALAELESTDASRPPLERVRYDDLHLIMYTSGTTGPSKGVMCPHSQGQAVGRALALDFGYRPDDVLYTCLPLFHGNAIWYTCYAALWADAAIALAPRFSASRFWDEIRDSGATQFNTLGAMTNIIWKLPPGPHERATRLRLCMSVPVPKEIYAEMQARYGITLTSVYAMTENFAMTRFTPDDPPEKAGSAGSTRGACELRIVDDDAQRDLPAGEVGEIWMRPLIPGATMKGYYRMPAETAREFVDGWFRTGDRGYLDADGYLYFVDRKKEAIRRRGENISAYEVELILSRHPSILEVAAIPVASEMSEDDVMVYVVTKPGENLTHADVVHFSAEHMSYFMVPRFVDFIDALPKTASEKIEKYKLKQDAQARRAELWDREREGIEVKR
jgi:crotonobetaine/carnitine-CoA ligase